MRRRYLCLLTVLIGSISATLMQNFITVSLPTVASELSGESALGWVIGSYMLASTLVLLGSGRWADRVGPRTVYVLGTLLYAAATIFTSQSQSMAQLIIFRGLQGVGAGMIVPAGMAALTRYWRGERLGAIIGLLGATQVAVTLIGAPAGGWLTSHLGWRPALASAVILSIIALSLSFSIPGRSSRTGADLRPLRSILREPELRRGMVGTAGLSSLAFAAAAYIPLAMVHRGDVDAATLGWLVLPLLAGSGVGSAVGGTRALRARTQTIAWLTAAAGVLLCLMPSTLALVIGGALIGTGAGMGMPAIFVRVQTTMGHGSEAVTSSLIQFSRNLGGGLGVPLYGATIMLPLSLSLSLPLTFVTMFVAACVGVILCWRGTIGTSVPAHSLGPASDKPPTQ